MSDSWIDKNELDNLVSGFSSGKRIETGGLSPNDIFDDIPSMPIPQTQPQANQVSSPVQLEAQIQPADDSPLRMLVNRADSEPVKSTSSANFSSPFSLDEDDEFDEINSQIEHLASETAKAMEVLKEVRDIADRNGLIPSPEEETDKEIIPPLDRIPLDVEIDPDLPLKGRLAALANILESYVGMKEMMVVDSDGFSLFSTKASLTVEKGVGLFVRAISKVYDSESDARSYTASQLAVEDDMWLCIVPTDGEIDGKFLLKALLPTPLDRPEIYVLVELLNEVLRPETR